MSLSIRWTLVISNWSLSSLMFALESWAIVATPSVSPVVLMNFGGDGFSFDLPLPLLTKAAVSTVSDDCLPFPWIVGFGR